MTDRELASRVAHAERAVFDWTRRYEVLEDERDRARDLAVRLEQEIARLSVLCPDCPGWGCKSKSGLYPGGPFLPNPINEG